MPDEQIVDFVPASEFDAEKHTQKISPEEELPKLPLRKRIHYWFCDRFRVVPSDDFFDLSDDFDELLRLIDELGVLVYKNMKIMTDFHKAQASFDKCVAERLHLDKNIDEDNFSRGMIF